MNEHFMILWETCEEADFGNELYEELSAATIPYLMKHADISPCTTPWFSHDQKVADFMEESIAGFLDYTTTAISAVCPKLIVCSPEDGLRLALAGKNPIIFYPLEPMPIAEIEDKIIIGWLINRYDRALVELKEATALIHKARSGVTSEADLNNLRKQIADDLDETLIRWGQYFGASHDPSAEGGA